MTQQNLEKVSHKISNIEISNDNKVLEKSNPDYSRKNPTTFTIHSSYLQSRHDVSVYHQPSDNKDIPIGRMNGMYQVLDSKVYIAGGIHASGMDQATYLTDVFLFDLLEKKYENMGVLNPALHAIDFNWYTPSYLDFGFFTNKDIGLVRVSISNNKYVTYQKFDTFLSKTISPSKNIPKKRKIKEILKF